MNILPPSSGSKSKPSNKSAEAGCKLKVLQKRSARYTSNDGRIAGLCISTPKGSILKGHDVKVGHLTLPMSYAIDFRHETFPCMSFLTYVYSVRAFLTLYTTYNIFRNLSFIYTALILVPVNDAKY
jgi:hypothetical protein